MVFILVTIQRESIQAIKNIELQRLRRSHPANKGIANFIDSLYASIVTAGTHMASSIRVAEAAKVIENTQRDVNIALINELAICLISLR